VLCCFTVDSDKFNEDDDNDDDNGNDNFNDNFNNTD